MDSTPKVAVVASGGKVTVTGPYHPEFPSKARKLGGQWRGNKEWVFDGRDEERVRELCRSIYGTDGSATEVVTVRVRLADHAAVAVDRFSTSAASLFLLGRQLARRLGRDSDVRLGDGVIVVEGGFASRGGSAKYPTLSAQEGTVLEVRDVPLALAQAEKAAHPEAIEIVAGDEVAAGGRTKEQIYRSALEEVIRWLAGCEGSRESQARAVVERALAS